MNPHLWCWNPKYMVISMVMGVPLYRSMVFVRRKIPAFGMDDVPGGSPSWLGITKMTQNFRVRGWDGESIESWMDTSMLTLSVCNWVMRIAMDQYQQWLRFCLLWWMVKWRLCWWYTRWVFFCPACIMILWWLVKSTGDYWKFMNILWKIIPSLLVRLVFSGIYDSHTRVYQ